MKYIALTSKDSDAQAAAETLLAKINKARPGEVIVMNGTEARMLRGGMIRLLEAPGGRK